MKVLTFVSSSSISLFLILISSLWLFAFIRIIAHKYLPSTFGQNVNDSNLCLVIFRFYGLLWCNAWSSIKLSNTSNLKVYYNIIINFLSYSYDWRKNLNWKRYFQLISDFIINILCALFKKIAYGAICYCLRILVKKHEPDRLLQNGFKATKNWNIIIIIITLQTRHSPLLLYIIQM